MDRIFIANTLKGDFMSFKKFLDSFIPLVENKNQQVNRALWLLETTGSQDAARLKADLQTELLLFFNDNDIYKQLLKWDNDKNLVDPILKRELNVLIRQFKPYQIPKELLEKISQKEANLSFLYSNFRPKIKDKSFSENEIKEILKRENDIQFRKDIWEASKQIGKILAPHIIELIKLRNESAHTLGYSNYFSMQLELQEVDERWLFKLLDEFDKNSESAYLHVLDEINSNLAKRFKVAKDNLGPWAWSDPFCQEDPLDANELDELVENVDMIKNVKDFYQKMDLDVEDILKRSDNFERAGKNQHAFCIHIDRKGDVRTLNNIKPTLKWLDTLLHELGHAVYELGFDPNLPWLLKEPPHMITTEAMALLMGRQAHRNSSLEQMVKKSKTLRDKAELSLKRGQLIFSRWVLVMTYFEKELYKDPTQNLNELWWKMVKKFQKINPTPSSIGFDWAAKYHIGLAPVYYYSYLLGEFFASSLEKLSFFPSKNSGNFLKEKLFKPANRLNYSDLIEDVCNKKLTADDWLEQFTK